MLGLILMAVVGTTIWDTIMRDHENEEAEDTVSKDWETTEEDYTLVDSGIRISVKFLSDKKQRKTRR